ncbi:ATP-binding protein [Pseudoalteromonas sp. T1lg75]|uniref:ATP-binding protein n=1 Tax=Pseudoalteromonas sp. T1lg75 TaxID=2077102 RepID=UPI000CF6B59D|nr:ATP-binding protein [Pseudoalteromonas sp. T1lg75]
MRTAKFSHALFVSIVWISLVPMLLVVLFFGYQFYQNSLAQAQQTLNWRANNDALALRQQLFKTVIDNERLANSKAIAELPIRILYSQFALTQLQEYVTQSPNIHAAMVIDKAGFIVEGFPLKALNMDIATTVPLLQQSVQQAGSSYFVVEFEGLQSSEAQPIAYLAIATPLNLERESLSTPYQTTGILLTLQPISSLISSLAQIEQVEQFAYNNTYRVMLADNELAQAGTLGSQAQLTARSEIVAILHNEASSPLTLTLSEPHEPHLSALRRSLAFAAILILSLGILALLLARWLVRRFNQPLKGITLLSKRYAQGQYESQVQPFSYREFEKISANLQSMAKTIEAQIASLKEQKHRAQASERAKSLFLANMSHELRTPLNGIFGYLQLLQSTPLASQQAQYTRQIQLSTQMLLTVINDILDFSKIEANKVVLERQPCDLIQLVKDINELFAPGCAQKGIRCTLALPEQPQVYALCDEMRLRQVLSNLVSNAVKFTSRGGIEIGLQVSEKGLSYECEFTVKDTGVGIAKELRGQLFQPFIQAQASTTREFGGTGLGLSICKRLLELMGGSISLASEPDEGSTFVVRLTLERSAPLSQINAEPMSSLQQVRFDGFRVLVAEDNPINQRVITKFLEKQGVAVHLVENGEQAIDAEAKQAFDLILMDIQMPVMDGLSASRAICAHNPEHAPIIAVSANAMSQDIEAALAAGMQDHLAKPIEYQALLAILHKWLVKKATQPS